MKKMLGGSQGFAGRSRLASRGAVAVAASTLVLLIAGGGYAIAKEGGTISACVHQGSGALYLKAKCGKKDSRITWIKVGPQGPAGPTGSQGQAGPAGPAGTARANAMVYSQGATLEPTRTKNFSAVTRPYTGIYCLTPSGGVTEAGAAPAVSVEWYFSHGSNLSAYWESETDGPHDCAAGSFEVRTYSFAAGGVNTLSDDVSFTIVVP
jgi:hypothetical protein